MKASMVAAVAAALAITACGSGRAQDAGPRVDRSYSVANFERIEVAGPYEVDVRTGTAPSVSATGPQRQIEHMVVEVEGNTLKIHPKKRAFGFRWSGDDEVRLTIGAPVLRAAEVAGSGGIRIDRVSGDSFDGSVAGSGGLSVAQLEVARLKMGIAGSGEIRAAGRANEASYEIAGSGDIDAGGLSAETAAVSIAGSGNVEAHASKTAKVDIAGSGDVRLKGGAQCEVSKAGSGNVDCS